MKNVNVNNFLDAIGGRKLVVEETGLTKGRISQWAVENSMPKPWIKYFMATYPNESKEHGISELLHEQAA